MKPTDPVPYSPEEIEEGLKFWIAARADVVPMASVMPYPRRLPEALMAARKCAECGTAEWTQAAISSTAESKVIIYLTLPRVYCDEWHFLIQFFQRKMLDWWTNTAIRLNRRLSILSLWLLRRSSRTARLFPGKPTSASNSVTPLSVSAFCLSLVWRFGRKWIRSNRLSESLGRMGITRSRFLPLEDCLPC